MHKAYLATSFSKLAKLLEIIARLTTCVCCLCLVLLLMFSTSQSPDWAPPNRMKKLQLADIVSFAKIALTGRAAWATDCLSRPTSIEFVAFKVRPSLASSTNIICCLHWPPNSKPAWMTAFADLMNNLSFFRLPITLLSDFNIDLLKNSCFAEEIFMNFGLKHYIASPTRVTHNTATRIDHIYTNSPLCNMSGTVDLAIAHHLETYCWFAESAGASHERANGQRHKQVSFQSVKKINNGQAHSDLTAIDWSQALNKTTIDNATATFVNLFLSGWDSIAPLWSRRVRWKVNAWMTHILDLIHQRQFVYSQFLRNKTLEDQLRYK